VVIVVKLRTVGDQLEYTSVWINMFTLNSKNIHFLFLFWALVLCATKTFSIAEFFSGIDLKRFFGYFFILFLDFSKL